MRHTLLRLYRRLPLTSEFKARLRYAVLRALPWAFPRAMRPGLDPSEAALATPLPGKSDWVIFGVIDWHLRLQRPQHLAIRLARAGHRVFYVSSNLVPAPGPGLRVEPLEDSGRLFQIHLRATGVPGIYYGLPGPKVVRQLTAGLRTLIDWSAARDIVLMVDHPFWLSTTEAVPDGLLVYDRMDYHAGFAEWSTSLASEEDRLIRRAALTVVTSSWLEELTAPLARSHTLVRNAAEASHFAAPCARPFEDPGYSRVIGYYGAIAHWFDVELIEAIARAFPDALVLLIGHDQIGLSARLSGSPNLRLIGEVPYADLPFYLHGFSVCLLPFHRIELTLATNPVKVYEYLAAGLPVVATALPEMSQFGDLVRIASDREGWLQAVSSALHESADDPIRDQRRAFAASQTWDMRAEALTTAVAAVRNDADWRSP